MPVFGNRRITPARAWILVVQVVVLESALTPFAEVIIQIRSGANTTALAIINVSGAIELVVEKEGIAAEQERPKAAAVAGHKSKVVGMRPEVARVVGKIENRHPAHVEGRAPGLDSLVRDDLDVFRPHLHRGLGHVIGGDDGVGGHVGPIRQFAMQPLAARKDRRLAGPELFSFQLVGLEIVTDVFADPDLVFVEDAHVAIGGDLA